MSETTDESTTATSPSPARNAGGGPRSKRDKSASSRHGVLAPLAFVLALIALAGVAFGGWQWWQWRQAQQNGAASRQQAMAKVGRQVAAVETQLAQQKSASDAAQQSAQVAARAVGERVDGMAQRVGSLEGAVASLARQNRNGHRAMLLDQAQMLLRMGQERYALFHDAAGALRALNLADQTLAAADDPALAGVRRTLAGERKALAATRPATRTADLAALAQLRATIGTLPLKPLAGPKAASTGFWSRLWRALSSAVVVRRVDGSPQSLADQRLTRRLASLDVAEAEAARAAWDAKAFHAALQRVAVDLAQAFDAGNPEVRQAQATIKRMLAEPAAGAAPALGKALSQLRDLRAVDDAAVPAEAGTVALAGATK